jgi:hypothetical protein
MKFNSDDEVKSFVDSALGKVSEEGRFVAHIRLQRPYENLPADQVDIGHLEWKIYTRDEHLEPWLEILKVDDPGMFAYWSLRVTSDYRLFIITHGNSSAGPWTIDNDFTNCSILSVQNIDDEDDFANHIKHLLNNYGANRYYLS